jgi:hypothetical protein
MFGVTSG